MDQGLQPDVSRGAGLRDPKPGKHVLRAVIKSIRAE